MQDLVCMRCVCVVPFTFLLPKLLFRLLFLEVQLFCALVISSDKSLDMLYVTVCFFTYRVRYMEEVRNGRGIL